MSSIVFVAKRNSVSQTISGLIEQLDDIQLKNAWVEQEDLSFLQNYNTEVFIIHLSGWDIGNVDLLRNIRNQLKEDAILLVIDIYKDPQLIQKIKENGATEYLPQEKVVDQLLPTINALL